MASVGGHFLLPTFIRFDPFPDYPSLQDVGNQRGFFYKVTARGLLPKQFRADMRRWFFHSGRPSPSVLNVFRSPLISCFFSPSSGKRFSYSLFPHFFFLLRISPLSSIVLPPPSESGSLMWTPQINAFLRELALSSLFFNFSLICSQVMLISIALVPAPYSSFPHLNVLGGLQTPPPGSLSSYFSSPRLDRW